MVQYYGYNDRGDRYYLAPSLVALFTEVDARWPNRDTKTDGWIGDASHQARESDHNPDWADDGVVRAADIDKDGISMAALLDALSGDPRVEYVIWNGRMMRSYPKTIGGRLYPAWTWAPYDGENPHTGHAHVSIKHTPYAETSTARWFTTDQPTPPEEDPLAGITAEAIGAAVAGALAPKLDAIEKKYTNADNDHDEQAATYQATGTALALVLIQQGIAAGKTPREAAAAAQTEVWAFMRPLWAT